MGERVAIIGSRGYPSTYGGFETLVRRLAPSLADEGFRVVVFCRRGYLAPLPADPRVERVVTAAIDRPALSTLSHGLTSSLAALRRPPDAALVLNVANGYFLPLLRLRGIWTVVNVDGIEWERAKWSGLGKRVFRLGARMTARFADVVVVDSREIGRRWANEFGRDTEFIPYGGDQLAPAAHQRPLPAGLESDGYILVVARLVPENHVDEVLQAHARLGSEVPCVVVGTAVAPSPIEDRLRSPESARRGVVWMGHIDDEALLATLWRECAVYVHGHSVGGTNPGLLQAMAQGAPVLAYDSPYNREVLSADAPFWGSAGELAELLDEFLDDAMRRGRARHASRRRVEESYRWPDVLARYADVLRSQRIGARASGSGQP